VRERCLRLWLLYRPITGITISSTFERSRGPPKLDVGHCRAALPCGRRGASRSGAITQASPEGVAAVLLDMVLEHGRRGIPPGRSDVRENVCDLIAAQ
jgi:hypothetical protein